MNKSQRDWLAEGLRELANLGLAAIIFGQIITGAIFDLTFTILGIFVCFVLYLWGFVLKKQKKKYGKN